MILALKNLIAERARFAFSVVGVGFAVLLVLVMSGLFVGTTNQVTTYIDHSKNAVWVTQPGVSQMFRAVSWLPADTQDRLLRLPEVKSADPILGQPSDFIHSDEQTAYFVVGYDIKTGVGGPWSLDAGRNISAPGEVVLDRVLARKNNIQLGDRVSIIDSDFTVVGFSQQTAALGNFYAFVTLPDAARLFRAGNRVSYFLVQPKAGVSDSRVVEAISQNLHGVNAVTSANFKDASRDIIISMIGRPLKTMIAIAVLVGFALVGVIVLAATAEQMSDFGVLRALGVRPTQLSHIVVAQAGLIATSGYVLGAAIAYGAQLFIRDRMGDVTVEITPPMLAVVALMTGAMALIGSVIPVLQVSRLDPALAFRR